jgi:hypothetical protein
MGIASWSNSHTRWHIQTWWLIVVDDHVWRSDLHWSSWLTLIEMLLLLLHEVSLLHWLLLPLNLHLGLLLWLLLLWLW